MRRAVVLTSFFITAPFVLIFCILFFSHLRYQRQSSAASTSMYSSSHGVAYAALPTSQNIFEEQIQEKDGRTEMVRQFFAKYKSPLEPYAIDVVEAADQYGLDYRLIPAIAMQESNLCKKAPPESYNCWGYGIYGKNVKHFEDYSDAIWTVTRTLAVDYKNLGLHTPEEIMSRYTPSSNGSWAYSVNHFMEKMQ